MSHRGTVSPEDQERLDRARAEREASEANFRDVVLDVTTRSSVRETAKAARVSQDTVSRWKRDQ